jgi:hypothetical protein
MKYFLSLIAFIIFLSLSLAFTFSDGKNISKSNSPFLNKINSSSCPYLYYKTQIHNYDNRTDFCPYFDKRNQDSENYLEYLTCPYEKIEMKRT